MSMCECPLNATGWLVQTVSWVEITNRFIDDIQAMDFNYSLCDILSAMGTYTISL